MKIAALAAGVNEALVDILAQQYGTMDPEKKKSLLVMNSQVIGVLTAAAQGGDEKDLQTGSWVAQNSTQYNYLFHAEIEQMVAERDACASKECKNQVAERYAELDSSRNSELASLCKSSPSTCNAILNRLAVEEPRVLELARKSAGDGRLDSAFVIGFSIAQSNSSAIQIIAGELSGNSDFELAFGDLLLASAAGGAGRSKPTATGSGDNAIEVGSTKILPGPKLPEKISDTFKDGAYANRQLAEESKFYKYHGVDNRTGRKFSWLSDKKYTSEAELRADLAIRHDWGVKITSVSTFAVPKGTWVSEGAAAAQGAGYPGGGYQAVITNLPKSWVTRTNRAF